MRCIPFALLVIVVAAIEPQTVQADAKSDTAKAVKALKGLGANFSPSEEKVESIYFSG